MNLRRIFIHGYFYALYGFHKITGTGAFGPDRATIIRSPVHADGNRLKSALLKHHVKQFHESSCSVATVVSAINAIRDGQVAESLDQQDILEKVRTAHWKERMSEDGYNGKRGLPLYVLGEVVKSSLDAYGIGYERVETVQTPKSSHQTEKIQTVLWKRLSDFEEKGNCLIIAHFDQGAFIPTLNIPHISPVGGFDKKSGQILMLDVDPQQEEHYKISFNRFYIGISSNYHHVLKLYGYDSGGYVYIELDT